jgi:hypothetical protein
VTAERALAGTIGFAALGLALYFFAQGFVGVLLLGLALGGWLHGVAALVRWATLSPAARQTRMRERRFGSPRYLSVVAVAFWVVGLGLVRAAFWDGLDESLAFWIALTGGSLVVSGWLHGCLAAACWADARSRRTATGVAHAPLSSTLLVLSVAVAGPVLSAVALGYAFGLDSAWVAD